jgi:putative membrane protein
MEALAAHSIYMMYYGYGYPGMYGFGLFDGIVHFVFAILVIVAIVWVIRAVFGGGRHMRRWHRWQMHDALSTLNERYAKGEIDTKEYEERKKTLMGDMK